MLRECVAHSRCEWWIALLYSSMAAQSPGAGCQELLNQRCASSCCANTSARYGYAPPLRNHRAWRCYWRDSDDAAACTSGLIHASLSQLLEKCLAHWRAYASYVPTELTWLLNHSAPRWRAHFAGAVAGAPFTAPLMNFPPLPPRATAEASGRARHAPLRSVRHQTCALVGNSGALLGSAYGAEIDAHDAVVRINSGLTAGYERHVGSRTTVLIERDMDLSTFGSRNPKYKGPGILELLRRASAHHAAIVYWVNASLIALVQARHLNASRALPTRADVFKYRHHRSILEVAARAASQGVRVHLIDQTPFEAIARYARSDGFVSKFVSTGELSVWLALSLCKRVDLYGFSLEPAWPYHYAHRQEGNVTVCRTCSMQSVTWRRVAAEWPGRLRWHGVERPAQTGAVVEHGEAPGPWAQFPSCSRWS
jgi:hypothetical protein